MKQTTMIAILGLTALVLLLVGGDGLFVVPVDRFVIVTEFGAPVRVLEEPGLYFKVPGVQHVVVIDKRIMSWDDQPQEVITLDKKRIYINSFARWRVEDPLKYYTAVRDESVAQMNLDKIIGGNIREIVSGNILDTLVRDTSRNLTYATEDSERARTTVELPEGRGRTAIVRDIVELSRKELLDTFGIAIIDVDIKQLNYTKSAQDATIRQMISEREKVAATYEAQGRKVADTIAGETQEQVLGLRGSATREKLRIEGEARAESSATKAVSFGQDPEFFTFIQTLELYQKGLKKNTTLYLSTDSELLSLLQFSGKSAKMGTPKVDLEDLMKELDRGGRHVEDASLESNAISPLKGDRLPAQKKAKAPAKKAKAPAKKAKAPTAAPAAKPVAPAAPVAPVAPAAPSAE